MELTQEQNEIIESIGKGLSILAGAGSGKTTTLVLKCISALQKNPHSRLIAVSFTEKSARDLKEKLAQAFYLNPSLGSFHKHWVLTIHGLCAAILREYPRRAQFDGEERILSGSESQLLWEEVMMELLWERELPKDIQTALEVLLARETPESLMDLLSRIKETACFGTLKCLLESSDNDSKSLGSLSHFFLEYYQQIKKRKGVLDFQDLERGAGVILSDPEIQKIYQKRFDFILVDEFQDTNPVQAEMLWKLAKPDLSNLCVVGDPKQSIYRFRDADVSVFQDYCRKLPLRFSLSQNFRSPPEILELVNDVCGKAFPETSQSYEALRSSRERSLENPVEYLSVESPTDLAHWILSQVLPFGDMALILRKIRGNEKWIKALTQAGIPIAIGSGGLFWEDPRVRELTAFLRWWDNPSQSLSAAIFLRSPWVGIQDLVLDEWVRQDPSFVKPFFESSHPLAVLLSPLKSKMLRPGELLLHLLSAENEHECGIQLLGLWHRAEELSGRGFDFHEVVEEFSRLKESKQRESEIPPPKNEGHLQVLTIHGAKGLEFPCVILVDFNDKPTRMPDTPLLYWDRKKGVFLAHRDPQGERLKSDPEELDWKNIEKQKHLAESMRLFYVALTRAQEKLVLVFKSAEEKREIISTEVYKKDDWRGWLECERLITPEKVRAQGPVRFENDKDLTPFVKSPHTRISFTLKRTRHSVTEWMLLSRCPRAYEWTYIRPVLSAQKDENLSAQEMGMTMGTKIHEILHHGKTEELRELEKNLTKDQIHSQAIEDFINHSAWMKPSNKESGRKVWSELQFEVPVLGQVLVGTMDRLIEEKGRFTILDYKITQKTKSQKTLLETYQIQLQIYKEALEILEPRSRGTIECHLVQISPESIESVQVPMNSESVSHSLVRLSDEIIQGKPGLPRPGLHCRYCAFREVCDATQSNFWQ